MAKKTTSSTTSRRKATGATKPGGQAQDGKPADPATKTDTAAPRSGPEKATRTVPAKSTPQKSASGAAVKSKSGTIAKPAGKPAQSAKVADGKSATAKPRNPTGTKPAADAAPAETDGQPSDRTPSARPPETSEANKDQARPAQPAAAAPAPERKGGAFPALVVGLIAGVIGGVGASYIFQNIAAPHEDQIAALQGETDAALAEQAREIASLRALIAASAPDLSGLEAAQAELGGRMSDAEDTLAQLSTRLTQLQEETLASALSEDAIAAYEAEFAALQEAMATQRAEIEAMTEEARKMETSAEETAQATMRRSALTRIQTALDTGGDYSDALADFASAGGDVPAALEAAATTGVTTLAELQAGFPDLAREALAAARDEAARSGEAGGATVFFRNILGARSLEPREGSDPDAVLSRAEAAVRENRLRDALAELESLPDVARTVFENWIARTERRLAAMDAAQALSEELN